MDLADDGLHLKESGKCVLVNNFRNGLNRFQYEEMRQQWVLWVSKQKNELKLDYTKGDLTKNRKTQSENEQNDIEC